MLVWRLGEANGGIQLQYPHGEPLLAAVRRPGPHRLAARVQRRRDQIDPRGRPGDPGRRGHQPGHPVLQRDRHTCYSLQLQQRFSMWILQL